MGGKKSLITTHEEGQNKSFIVGHSSKGNESGKNESGDGGNGKKISDSKKTFGLST